METMMVCLNQESGLENLAMLLDKRGLKDLRHALKRSKEAALKDGHYHRAPLYDNKINMITAILAQYGEEHKYFESLGEGE